jgi:hypothetical protein
MFARKALRAEITEGVDLEEGAFLTGERLSVGTGPEDDLRLGGAGIVPGHVVFAKGEKGVWEYFTSGAGSVEVSSGNPRTGRLRPGMTFRMGPDTVMKVTRAVPPAELAETGAAGEGAKEIPLAVALPVMALFVIGAGVAAQMMSGGGRDAETVFATAPWLAELPRYGAALDRCLERAGEGAVPRVPRDAPDAAFHAYAAARAEGRADALAELRLALGRQVRSEIVDAHLLVQEGRYGDAAATLRRVPPMLPTGNDPCPINAAARADASALERRAER